MIPVVQTPPRYHTAGFVTSDVRARLGLKAVAWARLSTAQAFKMSRPSRSPQLRLGWARPGPRPRPGSVKYTIN